MKRLKYQPGLTLVEIMVAVAIIAVLASITVRLATRIDNQGKERLTRATIATLNTALQQFADYEYRYPNPAYAIFDFPLDCNEFYIVPATDPVLQPTIENAMSDPPTTTALIGTVAGTPNQKYFGCEAMWFFLSQVPQCRQTLDKINDSLIKTVDAANAQLIGQITVTTPTGSSQREYPSTRVVDPWGTTLHYDYYDEQYLISTADLAGTVLTKKTFPVITSAGPDTLFGTGDDIRIEKTP